jgi:hypothetical protein
MNAKIPIKLAIKIMAHSDKVGMGAAEVAEATKVNRVLAALVPPGVVTKTLAVPALPAEVEQVAEVADVTVTPVLAVPPTVIPVAPVKLVPVMVMDVPLMRSSGLGSLRRSSAHSLATCKATKDRRVKFRSIDSSDGINHAWDLEFVEYLQVFRWQLASTKWHKKGPCKEAQILVAW